MKHSRVALTSGEHLVGEVDIEKKRAGDALVAADRRTDVENFSRFEVTNAEAVTETLEFLIGLVFDMGHDEREREVRIIAEG